MNRMPVFLFCMLFVGLVGCQRPEAKYGKEYNAMRQEVGLPIIPDNWTLYDVKQGYSTWVNPERIEKKQNHIPVHWSKAINYRTGRLLVETDTYFGILDYTTVDGTFRESISIAYHFEVDDFDSERRTGWSCRLVNQDTARRGGQEISLQEAEKILREWGIERVA